MLRSWLLLGASLVWVSAAAQTVAIYDSAVVDSTGQLRIHTSAHRELRPGKDSGQVGFDVVALSQDRRAVGWVALYPNCCTSYPIPLQLIILSHNGRRVFTGNGLPIWRWRFDSSGTRIAFYQDVVHGGVGGHYELHDVRTGRLIAMFEPVDSTPAPPWAAALIR
jgi:hypothetical protein